MPEHRLPAGVEVIARLTSLGQLLGYRAEQEVPVGGVDSEQAVDVAWFASDQEGSTPLFVFEVESRLTNSSTANALKVLGADNFLVVKPLFFFHVYVTGGERSRRLADLQRTFGTHNYRVYRLAQGEATHLLRDVISQHRRLTERLDAGALCRELLKWEGVALDDFLDYAESQGFGSADNRWRCAYAALALEGSDYFRARFEGSLRNAYLGTRPPMFRSLYPSYLGQQWFTPIDLALCAASEPTQGTRYLEMLRWWQEDSTFMPMIRPRFGLSQDYDEFIVRLSPSLWGLLAGLMRATPGALNFILDQARQLLDAELLDTYWHFAAAWTLLIAAAMPTEAEYERVRREVNARGGLTCSYLPTPPGFLPSEVSEEAEAPVQPVPTRAELVAMVAHTPPTYVFTVAVQALLADEALEEWARGIAGALLLGSSHT